MIDLYLLIKLNDFTLDHFPLLTFLKFVLKNVQEKYFPSDPEEECGIVKKTLVSMKFLFFLIEETNTYIWKSTDDYFSFYVSQTL